MRHFHLTRNKYYSPIINVEKIWSLIGDEARAKAAESKDSAALIDVTKYGYFKVLGKGQIPNQPLLVRAKFVSKLAEEKIRAAGGAVELVA